MSCQVVPVVLFARSCARVRSGSNVTRDHGAPGLKTEVALSTIATPDPLSGALGVARPTGVERADAIDIPIPIEGADVPAAETP